MHKFSGVLVFLFIFGFCIPSFAQHCMCYEIKGKPSIVKIIENVENLFPGDISEITDGVELIKKVDIEISSYMRPKLGYYKFEGRLCENKRHIIGFYKSLEFWEKSDSIIVRSYINITPSCHNRFPFRWINRKRAKIVNSFEPWILQEECYLLQDLFKR